MSLIKNLPIANDLVVTCIKEYELMYGNNNLPEKLQDAYTTSIDFSATDLMNWMGNLSKNCKYDTLRINLGVYTNEVKSTIMEMGEEYRRQGERITVGRLAAFVTPYFKGNIARYEVATEEHKVDDIVESLNFGELHP